MNRVLAVLLITVLCLSFGWIFTRERKPVIPGTHISSQKFIYQYDQRTGIKLGKWQSKDEK